MITSPTCRAARGLLNLTQDHLADAAGVKVSTIEAFEGGGNASAADLSAIRTALEMAGVEFPGAGAAVRLKGPHAADVVKPRQTVQPVLPNKFSSCAPR